MCALNSPVAVGWLSALASQNRIALEPLGLPELLIGNENLRLIIIVNDVALVISSTS